MPSPHSLRRLANLTKKVHEDLRKGGMAMTFKYIFRSTAILARVTAILADYVATQAGEPAQEGWEPPGGRGLRVERPAPKKPEAEREPGPPTPTEGPSEGTGASS